MRTILTGFTAAIFGLSLLGGAAGGSVAQEKPPASRQEPDKREQEKHRHDVEERGDHVMGFSHEKATHHFRLYADGGAIEVTANDAQDTATREAIEGHLSHVVKMFAAGDFTAPMLVHSQSPPGVETMKRLRDAIEYRLDKAGPGARIRITTKNAAALEAVHAFLRFQIADHQTGDTTEVSSEAKTRVPVLVETLHACGSLPARNKAG
jgi:hypothetical protein